MNIIQPYLNNKVQGFMAYVGIVTQFGEYAINRENEIKLKKKLWGMFAKVYKQGKYKKPFPCMTPCTDLE